MLLALLGIYSALPIPPRNAHRKWLSVWRSARSGPAWMRLIVVSSAKLGLLGCAIGALAAVLATRLLRSLLFEVDPLDPTVIVWQRW